MFWWRFKARIPCGWRFGYATREGELWRMGSYNGDTMGGVVVDASEVEVREYRR